MSNKQMKKYNIVSIRTYGDEILISDISKDEWIIRGNTLYHRNNKGTENEFHYQKKVDNFAHAIKYISGHATRLTRKSNKVSRMDYLFSLI